MIGLLWMGAALAAETATFRVGDFDLGATERLLFSLPPDAVVDDQGTTIGQRWALDQRLRVDAAWHQGRGVWETEWDLATGQVAGDPWDIPVDVRGRAETGLDAITWATPRKLKWTGRLGPFQLATGLDTSHWGLGLLSNDGAHRPLFGRVDGGDRVGRVALATRPFGSTAGPVPIYVALLADLVVEDENARLVDGQRALQAIATAFYQDGDGRMAGVYFVGRDQLEADGARRTRVAVADLAFDLFPAGDPVVRPRLAFEAAGILGTTSRATTYNATDALQVMSGGAAAEAGVDILHGVLGIMVRGGWASGDTNPDDDITTDFTFDPNFSAGMVLFDELAAGIEASTYAELSDPENAGQPPDGAELLVTGGAVRRAKFVQPVLHLQPLDWFRADAGVMAAWSTAPWSDPYLSFRAGGTPVNHLGEPITSDWLGLEIDWSASFTPTFSGRRADFTPGLRIQGGHLMPGEVLGGGMLHLVMVEVTGRF